MSAISEAAWRDLIGLPYEEGARGPDAYDCLGAMEAVLHAAFGIEGDLTTPPSMDDDRCRWISSRDATDTPGAVIVTRAPCGMQHVWTVIDAGRVLSALPGRGVCVLPTRIVTRGAESIVGCYLHMGIPA